MARLEEWWNSWQNGGREPPYLLLDCAGFEHGAAQIPRDAFAELECLFTGDLAVELEDVAPYMARLASFDPVVRDTVEDLLEDHLGIVVLPKLAGEPPGFGELHRHFRKHNVVYGPDAQPLFFRYYDPRALLDVLDTFDAAQLRAFFGPVEALVMNDRQGELVRCWVQGDGLVVAR